MRHSKVLVVLTAAAVVGALTVGTAAQASSPPLTSATPAGGSSGTGQTVRLVTGDVVRLALVDGRPTTQVVRAQHSGPGAVFQTFTQGGDQYVVPQSAVPYLGRTLDAGLFDVTRLAQNPRSSTSVRVELRDGGSAAALHGLVSQSRHGSTVTGSLTAAGAKALGRALAAQSMRDHAASTHRTGLFRGIARIASGTAGPTGGPIVDSADSTLTVKGINWDGDPDSGDSYNIYSVDDINLSQSITFVNGTAQLTVPDGHYSAVGFFYDFATGTIYQVTLAQFTVHGDTTVTVDARDATSPVSITTPRPSTPLINAMGVGRSDVNGVVGSYSFLAGNQPFFVKPIRRGPSIGKLYYWVYTRAQSSGSKQAYTYDLKMGSVDRIAADQSYTPSARSLAAIDSAYYADHAGQQSLDARFGVFSWETFGFAADLAFTAPTRRTEYYTADDGLSWAGVDYQVYVPDPFTLQGEIDSSWRRFESGWTAFEPWGDDPSHPRMLEHNIFLHQVACPACVSGTTLNALVFPFGDNSWQHRTYPDQPGGGLSEAASWDVTADGGVAQQGSGVLQASANVGKASTYGLDYDTTRSSDDFTLSTKTHTSWTVPADAPQADLPQGWTCTVSGGTDCTVLPVMTVNYNLPVTLLGELAAGKVTGSLRIGHLAHNRVPVASLKAKVSYDGGSTYQDVKVTKGAAGKFTLQLTVPSPGRTDGYGMLSVTAKDTNGSTLTEEITRAFAVTAS